MVLKSQPRLLRLALVVVVVVYGVRFLAEHLHGALAQAPQLDARENLLLAESIAAGTLPAEPFYRAMGYPAVLALFSRPDGSWVDEGRAAALLGLFLHWANAFLVGYGAWRLWSHRWSAWIAGGLYGLYPVALFFAVQVLDVTLGITLFLGGLAIHLTPGRRDGLGVGRWALVGLLWGLAVVVRPHFLFVIGGGTVVALLGSGVLTRRLARATALALAALAPILVQALVGLGVGGQFHLLPWQGAYNLHAANRPGANGRYFAQQVVVTDRSEAVNPTRAESEVLFAAETGAQPPFDPKAMNAFWRNAFVREVAMDPAGWLGLLTRKAAYVLHDFEQYNNLTYDFHKARSDLLRYNPLGWGVLLLAAVAAIAIHGRTHRPALLLVVIALAYAASLLAFYASARFRLPLVPVLFMIAAGLGLLGTGEANVRRPGLLVAALTLTGVAAFFPFFGARSAATHVQDALLVANASSELGWDQDALREAEKALAVDPGRAEARRLALISYWNLRLDPAGQWQGIGDWDTAYLRWVKGSRFTDPDPALAAALGTVLWHNQRAPQATKLWSETAARFPENRAVLDGLLALADDRPEDLDPTIAPMLRPLLEPALPRP